MMANPAGGAGTGGHVHANSRGRQVRDKPGVPVCARESGHGINPCRRAAREDIEAGTACRPPAAEGSFAVSGAGRAFFRRVPGAVGKPQGQKVLFRLHRRRQQRVSAVISSVDKAQQIAMPRMHRLRKNRPSTNILIPPLRLYRAARVCASCRLPEQALLPVYARLAVLRTAIRDKRQTCPFPVQALYISWPLLHRIPNICSDRIRALPFGDSLHRYTKVCRQILLRVALGLPQLF